MDPIVNLRRATIVDLEALVKLRLKLLYEVGNLRNCQDMAVAEANKQYLLENLPKGDYMSWVAEAGGIIIAISGLLIYRRPPVEGNLSGLEGYIMNMYTVPEYRRRGFASLLLETIIDFVKSKNIKTILLHADKEVQPLYKKYGFQETNREMKLSL